MDRSKEVDQAIALVFSAFRQPLDPDTLEAYRIGLEDVESCDLMPGVRSTIQQEAFFPAPATVRDRCKRFERERHRAEWLEETKDWIPTGDGRAILRAPRAPESNRIPKRSIEP